MAGTGFIGLALSYVLAYLGVKADTSQVAGWVDAIIKVVSLLMILIGHMRRPDLKGGLIRK